MVFGIAWLKSSVWTFHVINILKHECWIDLRSLCTLWMGIQKIFNTEMKFSCKVFQFESIQVKHTNYLNGHKHKGLCCNSDQFVPINIFTWDENVSSLDLLNKPGSKKANLGYPTIWSSRDLQSGPFSLCIVSDATWSLS